MNFKEVALEDKELIEQYTRQTNYFMCTYCFVDLFIWQFNYGTEFAVEEDILYLRSRDKETGKYFYLFPLGNGDLKKAFENIENMLLENGQEMAVYGVPEAKRAEIENLFSDRFEFTETRDSEDYIYLAEKMMNLKGKKLHSKRNFINRFKIDYEGRWKYESLNDENMHDIFKFHLEWCGQKDCEERDEFLGETCAISRALKNYKTLGIKGGLLRLDGKVIAFTLGSKSHDDMYIVHIEKGSYDINGAYQMINQLFAQENFGEVMYVDREEDLGIEGLRKAKMSYYPDKMGICYSISVKKK